MTIEASQMRYSLLLLALLALPALGAEPAYSWGVREDDPDRIYLYRDGTQVGGWCYRTNQYRPYDGANWGTATSVAPVPAPVKPAANIQIMPGPTNIRLQPQPRLFRPIRSAVDSTLRQVIEDNVARWVGEALDNAFKSGKWLGDIGLYALDVDLSAKLFAQLEMGGKLDENSGERRMAQQILVAGCARIFIAEKAKFADALKKEGFSNLALTGMHLEIVDHILDKPKEGEAVQSFRVYRNQNLLEEKVPSPKPNGPSVPMTIRYRTKDAAEKTPVTVHCSFGFTAEKNGKTLARKLLLVTYLDSLELTNGWYSWKVRNVEFK